jgi:hypothetical protein
MNTAITLEYLKENRVSVIAQITEKVGASMLKEVMDAIVWDINCYFPDDSVELRINEAIAVCNIVPQKSSIASLQCEYELDNNLKFNHVTESYN